MPLVALRAGCFQAAFLLASSSGLIFRVMVFFVASSSMVSSSCHQGDGASFVCFGGDMTDDETVGAAAEAAVGDEGDAFAETGADDGRSRLEHFGHAGCSFGADVADDDDIAGPDLAGVDAGNQFVLAIEDAGGAFEAFAFLAADLGYAAAFGQVAVEDLQMAGGLDRFFQRVDDILFFEVEAGISFRFSARVLPVTVRQSPWSNPFSSRYFMTAGMPPC
jgi:hypothetical protein